MVQHRELIGRMDAWLAVRRPDYHALLQPGVDDGALDAFEAKFSLKLPEAFRALYRWRNGQPNSSFDSLQGNRMFSALEDIADTKEMLDDMIGFDFEDPATWRRGWVPFLSNGGGSYLCVDIDTQGGGQPGQLVGFWKADEDRPVEHASVEAWLAELVASMEAGTVEFD
ncbi:Cell wall assembly regulator SMI1 [Variovorax sp. NFACC28]|nr:Cell wall assembly regulator SMI1 [Variovorax sp. NFACC28]SEG94070.1 Cell wall assembly regulator SMI1 [Variovorax sp. NFACC29]SFD57800.1 Cell wall assembly regulator SMI1 [Variovorax sp. NFACC26]SFG88512.1 Cell wall assembly regulator SMI1 [Variovorax sp. NFACC27]